MAHYVIKAKLVSANSKKVYDAVTEDGTRLVGKHNRAARRCMATEMNIRQLS